MADVSLRETQNLTTTVVGLQNNPVSPNAPAVGDMLVWNGSVWIPTAPGPVLGVTDGSDAPPGYVGEYMYNEVELQSMSLVSSIPTATATLSLTAGDWNVDALAVLTPSTSNSLASGIAYIGDNSTVPLAPQFSVSFSAGIGDNFLGFSRRISLATPTDIALMVSAQSSDGSDILAGASLGARRMR